MPAWAVPGCNGVEGLEGFGVVFAAGEPDTVAVGFANVGACPGGAPLGSADSGIDGLLAGEGVPGLEKHPPRPISSGVEGRDCFDLLLLIVFKKKSIVR